MPSEEAGSAGERHRHRKGTKMAVQLNHTIVHSREKATSAAFYCSILGLADPVPYGPFLTVALSNDVTLDFVDTTGTPASQHYAFLVGEDDFDAIFTRIKQRRLAHYARPGHGGPGEHNTNDGGRGVYWDDPDGHSLEIITRPYGSGA